MVRTSFLFAAFALTVAPAAAQESCGLCTGDKSATAASDAAQQPLTIEIDSGLVFSRLALTGERTATAQIDPQSGNKQADSGFIDLGGMAVTGRARITGVPGRSVQVIFPSSVTMTSTTGGSAELSNFTTDLPAWPVLDAGGTLEFSFGGKLTLSGPVGGSLHGRIPIRVDYN